MRLNPTQRTVVRQAASQAFGDAARFRLFGYYLRDDLRVGDIAFLVETREIDPPALASAHTQLLVIGCRLLREQRIEVLINCRTLGDKLPTFSAARAQVVLL